MHTDFIFQARKDAEQTGAGEMGFAPLMANTRGVVESADLAVCHLETSIGPAEGPFSGYPLFSSPPQLITGLKATGYDFCTTASNHSFDTGAQGIENTLNALDAAGLGHVGSARTQAEAEAVSITPVATPNGEVKVAGADLVILHMHWGTEHQAQPDAQQTLLAEALTRSPDIDAIVGGHAHVVQPIRRINGTWVVFGTGNVFACHRDFGDPDEEGIIVRLTFAEQSDGSFTTSAAEYLPILATCTFDGDSRVMDIPAALASGDTGPYGQERLELAQARTAETVNTLGGAAAGLQPLTK
ncbi:MAG: poly-gamma-glutamate biosynthesis protein [Actinomycetota bacterium]